MKYADTHLICSPVHAMNADAGMHVMKLQVYMPWAVKHVMDAVADTNIMDAVPDKSIMDAVGGLHVMKL